MTQTGIRQNPAAFAGIGRGRAPHRHHSPPMTAPMSGKAHMAYRMFFWFHANCGTGRAENMAKATAMVCNPIIFPLLYNRPGCRTPPAPHGQPGRKGIVHLRQRFQVAPGVACVIGTAAEHLVGDHDEVRALSGQLVQSFQNDRSRIFSRPAGS